MVPLRGASSSGSSCRPTRTAATPTRRRSPATTREYILDKIVSKKFADSGSKVYTLIKNFNWTNDDQNVVAGYINSGMTHEEAGKKWADANEAKWKAWIGQ